MLKEKGPDSINSQQSDQFEVVDDGFFENINEMNIPVDIWLSEEEDEEGNKTGYYILSADAYSPRKKSVGAARFELRSKNPDALRKVVRDKIMPLYQTALERLQAVADGKTDNLYYWQSLEQDKQEEGSIKE